MHLSGELFSRMAGIQMQHVPYGGPPENLAKGQRDDFAKWSKVIKHAGVKPQ